MTSDGSYYVWIPRYGYRIIYFDTEEHENAYREGTLIEEEALKNGYIVGYSDARGIVDSDGKRPTSISSTTAISVNDKKLRTHPAFDGNVEEGGWDSKLTGIWVMKYEASRNDASATSTGSGTIPKSVPNVKSFINSYLSEMFIYARDAYNKNGELNTTLNSHMMKNSEWGAVAYLTDSKYGRNGTAVSVNQCSDRITGVGRGLGTSTIYNSSYTWSSLTTDEQKYNGTIGQLSSTTGNIYGIYDTSGGSVEFVMGFYQDEDDNIYTGASIWIYSGFNGLLGDGNKKEDGIEFPAEKKYYQAYKNETNSNKNINGGILGDATKETNGENGIYFSFVNSKQPVFVRGGSCNYAYEAVIFKFSSDDCVPNNRTFRVSLAIK